MLTVADGGRGNGQKLADVICERSLYIHNIYVLFTLSN